MKDPIAITGMGCISAAGTNVNEHECAVAETVRHCKKVPEWLFETKLNYPVFACQKTIITDWSKYLLNQLEITTSQEMFSRTFLLLLSAVGEALDSANLSLQSLHNKKIGIALGTTVGCTFNDELYYEAFRKNSNPPLEPVLKYIRGNLAYSLQNLLGTHGPTIVVTNACASGTDAIGIARNWLNNGVCDLAIVGGADELSRIALNGFASLMLTDASPCKPFDQNRQGLNLGEGAGILILEPEHRAYKRKKEPFGWVKGYAACSDAWHPTAPNPDGKGLVMAAQKALEEAGDDICPAMINAHGTGTPSNDSAEEKAIRTLFPQPLGVDYISTKGLTGHTLGAAGAIEAVLTVATLRKGVMHGSVGCLDIDSKFQSLPVKQGKEVVLANKIGLSLSLAFGGGNSALVLEGNV